MEPEVIVDRACQLGEGPLWHPDEKRIYWADILAGQILRCDPATGAPEVVYEGRPVGGFTLQQDGSLLLFMDRGSIAVWRQGELEYVVEEIQAERQTRFNDVIADPEGRVFCGTMGTEQGPGRLYRLDRDGSLTEVVDGIGVSNGMGFTPDRKRMYYIDSPTKRIDVFDYDQATGELSGRRVFVDTQEDEGIPDGMTVDAQGCVWSARWDGGCLVRYTPDGREERRVRFPARKVTSLTFGGQDCAEIYATTASLGDRQAEGPAAGSLFRVRAGIRGVPEFRSRIGE